MADEVSNSSSNSNQSTISVTSFDISKQTTNTAVLPEINISDPTTTSASPNASDAATRSNYLQTGRQKPDYFEAFNKEFNYFQVIGGKTDHILPAVDNETDSLQVSDAIFSNSLPVDNDSGCLQPVDNKNSCLKVMNSDPDYQRLVSVDDEPGYQRAVRDELGSYRKTDDNAPRAFDEPGYLQIMNDESGYIEVLNDEPNYLQIVTDEIGYLQAANNEPDYLQPLDSESSYLQPIDNLSSYLQAVADEPSYLREIQHVANDKLGILEVVIDDVSYLQNVQVVQPANSRIETDYLQQVQIAANEPHNFQAGNTEQGDLQDVRVVVLKSDCRQLGNVESEHHQAIDTVAGHYEIIDNETGYNEIEDNGIGYSEVEHNEPRYHEIVDYESGYQQVVSDDFGYSEIDIIEQLSQPRAISNSDSPVAFAKPDADGNGVRHLNDANRNNYK